MAVSSELETAVQLSFESLSTGYLCIRDNQKEAVLAALSGKDVFIRLPTGYGKTLITAVLPGAFDRTRQKERHFMVLCVCPLISLMIDQRRRLRQMGVTADFLGSAQDDKSAVQAIVSGQVQCILASPETILKNQLVRDMLLSPLYQEYLAAIIIDEAHCISHWLVACLKLIYYINPYSNQCMPATCSKHCIFDPGETNSALSTGNWEYSGV